jgi:hypothetical protein
MARIAGPNDACPICVFPGCVGETRQLHPLAYNLLAVEVR